MSATTLHRILWGVGGASNDLGAWRIRPWEIPAVGLPVRVGTALFLAARQTVLPADWEPQQGPLTWNLKDPAGILAAGRRHQFGFGEISPSGESISKGHREPVLAVCKTTDWEVLSHSAYYLPFAGGSPEVHPEAYSLYCDVLLLLTALDGGETILDRIAELGAGSTPFEDRWSWRSRLHLPAEAWESIHHVVRWSERPERDADADSVQLQEVLGRAGKPPIAPDDFLDERIDLQFDPSSDHEVARTVRRTGAADEDLPPELCLDESGLRERMRVRICQVSHWPEQPRQCFPRIGAKSAGKIMEQVASAFQSPTYTKPGSPPEVVVLPEVSIPQPEVRTLRDLVRHTGRASLAGLYWRVLPPAYRAGSTARTTIRWFVNEAELAMPMGHDDRGPTSLRWYRVRKPLPAHSETGLALHEHLRRPGECWRVLAGRRWYRFLHPRWGDFSIAICSDLIDAAPWRSLRGELLHLFVVAHNRDVDLYDSLTWVRAYENYVNLVAVNHGRYGGSALWTPRRKHDRELARLHGSGLFVVADIEVPVSDLLKAQLDGVSEAVCSSAAEWQGTTVATTRFKAPPPGFRRRAMRSRADRSGSEPP